VPALGASALLALVLTAAQVLAPTLRATLERRRF